MAATRATTKKAASTPKARTAKKAPSAKEVRGWEEDPGEPTAMLKPIARPVPMLGSGPLAIAIAIAGKAPPPKLYNPGTNDFRYWALGEALRRGADLWSSIATGLTWFKTVGPRLEASLDFGEDLNAYYDRQGLRFFHGSADGRAVFSGESPDVACHELGHAVLDALRPQLFDTAFIETAAFHESFGDMSAMLSALQLESVRNEVLVETAGNLYRSSRLSRLAEQLGWAIRLVAPDAVEPDCLRNAVNSFFYHPPEGLPPSGPANTLSSEPHSFSRVFTGAFLDALAGMFRIQASHDQTALLQTSQAGGRLLVEAVSTSPVVPSYYSQVAAQMIEADAAQFGGKHGDALKAAFTKHGILSLESVQLVSSAPRERAVASMGVAAAGAIGAINREYVVALPGQVFGLDGDLLVPAPAETKRFGVAGAAPEGGTVEGVSHDRAARAFVEDLFRRGNVDVAPAGVTRAVGAVRPGAHTHEVRREDRGLVLVRRFFACGGTAPVPQLCVRTGSSRSRPQ